MAVEQLGLTTTVAKKLSKAELCRLLGLPVPTTPLAQKMEQVVITVPNAKICTKKRSVPRFSRLDLELAALALGKTKKEIKAMSYDALCAFLKFPTSLPPAPSAPAPPVPMAMATTTTATTTTTSVPNCIARSNKALRDHQKAVCRYMDTHRGLIVFHKVGSGKTLTAITVSQCYLDKHPTHRVLVVAPAGLLNNFKDEMTKSYVNVKHGDRYEFYSYQKFTSLVKKHKKPVCRNTLVVIDEGHNLRTPFQKGKKGDDKGINTKNILDCARLANKVLVLTGTPIYNSRNDIFTLFNMIRGPHEPEIPKSSYAAKNKEEGEASFRRLFCKISYHDTSGDPNFPTRINVRHSILMSPEYKAKYLQVIEKIKDDNFVSDVVDNVFGNTKLVPFFNAVRRAVNNLDNTDANRKLDWVVRTLTSFPRNEKAIVFSNFLDAGLRLIVQKLPPSYPYAIIEGKVPMAQRKQIVHDFNEGKYRALFLSRAGGEGLDMKGARHVILMDPTWNEATNEQVIGRAIRYRSHAHLPDPTHHNVTVHYLQHIFKEDQETAKEVETYLKRVQTNPGSPAPEPEVSPYENSFDLFLSFFLRKKQVLLDKYNELLKSYSIERNQC